MTKSLLDLEGCRLQGSLEVNKVPGSLHITTHSAGFFLNSFGMSPYGSLMGGGLGGNFGGESSSSSSGGDKNDKEVSREKIKRLKNLDISHQILHLSFGDDADIQAVQKNLQVSESNLNILDGETSQVFYKEWNKNSPDSSGYFMHSFNANPMKKEEEAKIWKSEFELRRELLEKMYKSAAENPAGEYGPNGAKANEASLRAADKNWLFEWMPQATIFEYYCNVVPTTYRNEVSYSATRSSEDSTELHVYQYTANSNRITSTHMPSIYIRYKVIQYYQTQTLSLYLN